MLQMVPATLVPVKAEDMGFGVWDLGVWDVGLRVWDLGLRVWDLGFGV